MTLSQAVLCIDKDYCKKVSISVEFSDGSRIAAFKSAPNNINNIFARVSPLSRVLAFLDRKGSVNIVVAYTVRPHPLRKQIDEGVWEEELYV